MNFRFILLCSCFVLSSAYAVGPEKDDLTKSITTSLPKQSLEEREDDGSHNRDLFLKACDGDMEKQRKLYNYIEEGSSDEWYKAFEDLLKEKVAANNPMAQFVKASQVITRDPDYAITLLDKAIANNCGWAALYLTYLYLSEYEDILTKCSSSRAKEYEDKALKIALRINDPVFQTKLGDHYIEWGNYQQAFRLYNLAAIKSIYPKAAERMLSMAEEGIKINGNLCVAPNQQAAAQWRQKLKEIYDQNSI